jgi:VWFA-related protein
VLSALTVGGQESSPQLTYRTGVEMVRVEVSVLDRDRHAVTGLRQGDFVLRVDGKVTPVAAFNAVALPERQPQPSAAWMREVGPDVVTNLAPREGRLVVLVLDYSIRNADIPSARRTAHAALDQLGPGDMAAVVYTSVGVPQNFTADRRLLRSAIDRPFLGIDVDPDDPFGSHRGECRCGLCSLEVMTNVADAVREVPNRRKMLFFIGSDVSVTTTSIECFAEVREAREKLLRAAGAANLTIHTFDSMLLQSGGYSASQSGGIPEATDASARSPQLRRQLDLAFFPGETGGRAIKNTNAPWEPMPAIFAETESYYVLGFAPSSPGNDGAFHTIAVDVDRSGIEVHPRTGYYSPAPPTRAPAPPPDAPPAALSAAVRNMWPETQIPMGVTTAAFAAPAGKGASVVVVARAQESGAQSRPTQINVLTGAYDREGKPLATQVQTVVVAPSAAGQKVFQYEASSRLRLAPGRHEIRVAAEDPSRHLIGSVYTYAEVPDFAKAAVSLSGVILSLRPSGPDGPFRDLFPLEPTARREFTPTSHVTAFVRVYQSAGDGSVPVTLRRRIIDASNHAVQESSEQIFDQRNSASHSADDQFELPLASLAAGQYLLTIDATRKEKQTAHRDIVFSIR